MSKSTKMAWEKVKLLIENARKPFGQRVQGEYIPILKWFEYFYNEVQKREQQLALKTN